MTTTKKFQQVKDLTVYPSLQPTIEVIPTDGYNGAHRYRLQLCTGFDSKKITPGLQSEQLALILLDRVKKLNERYPSEQNDKQIEGLTMYLQACKERIDDRINRGVMGELQK